MLFHHFAYFVYVFIRVFNFVHILDRSLATRETIIAILFSLFSGFYCFLSHIHIWIALRSWFYLVLVLVLVSQEPKEDETRGVSM